MKILLACEPADTGLDPISLELIAAARAVASPGDEVIAALIGAPEDAKAELGAADRIVCVPGSLEAARTPESAQAVFHDLIAAEAPDLVLTPYSAIGLDLAPWLAGRTGMGMIAYVTGLERDGETVVARSQLYAGKLQARSAVATPCILSMTPGAYEPVDARAADTVETREATLPSDPRMRLLSVDAPDLGGFDLTKSERILCVGRGISDENGVEQARGLAERLQADLAGSRPVIDNGMLEKMRQVGKSGQKVKPKLYVALGVSGAPEHLEGMGGSDVIVAVNTDPNAPIFNVAHYSAVCDLFEFMDALNDLLEEQPLATSGSA